MAIEGGIFSNSLEVSFDRLKQDLKKRGRSRLLWQFRNSPVINQVVDRLSEQFQDTYDATFSILEGRTIAKAAGVSLDILGSLVGQEREFSNLNYTRDDDNYRRLILAKIFKNHAHTGSVVENRYCAKYISGSGMSFVKIGLQAYRMAFPVGVQEEVLLLFRSLWKNMQVDNYYLLPIPATVRLDLEVAIVLPMEDGYSLGFGPDLFETRPDYAKAAISINIGALV